MTLTPGTSYHLAAVWQNGSQQYYLNGNRVKSDSQIGVIGVLGDTATHAYRLGSDSSGTDVTIDEPTLWNGYALSSQDVLNLCNRVETPQAIASTSIILQWSLAGSDGIAVQIGDPGLIDGSVTGLNLASVVGTAPTYQGGTLSYTPLALISTASVAASGKSISLLFENGGVTSNVTKVVSANDVQTLTVIGEPANNTFALTFNGQTTAPIPVVATQPTVYALWTAPVTAGTPYAVSATWFNQFANNSIATLFEFFADAGFTTLLGSATVNQQISPSDFTYGNSASGASLHWKHLGTCTPTGSSLYVRVSCNSVGTDNPNHDLFFIAGLLVENTSNSTYQVLDPANTAELTLIPSRGYYAGGTNVGLTPSGPYYAINGTGAGTTYVPNLSTMLANLQSLSTIGSGNISLTASNYGITITATFVGALGNVAQPQITATDPAISIAHTTVGGVAPTIQINSGAPISLPQWLYTTATPYVMCPLIQSSPVTQVLPTYCGEAYTTGGWGSIGGGYRGGIGYYSSSTSANSVAYFPFQGLPPATYQLAMTWVASNSLSKSTQVSIQDVRGNSLSVLSVDQTVPPADFTAVNPDTGATIGWKILGTFSTAGTNGLTVLITCNGLSTPVLADAIMLTRTSADVSVMIEPTDVVTLSLPTGYFTTAAGSTPAITNLHLANNSGMIGNTIVPFSAVPKTLKVGYNVEGESTYAPFLYYSNLAHRIGSNICVQQDANGYPTVIAGSSIRTQGMLFSTAPPGEYTPGIGTYPNAPSGLYTLMWDGACNVQFHSQTPVSQKITGTTNNIRIYNCQALPTEYAPQIYLDMSGTVPNPADPTGTTYLCDLQNLRIFPPDPSDPTGNTAWINTTNPPTFHPSFLTKLQGAKCLRFMDQLQINNSSIGDYADLKNANWLSYGASRNLAAPITSIVPYTGSSLFFDQAYYYVIQVTTSTPHTFQTGMQAVLSASITLNLANSTTYTGTFSSFVYVLSPTTLLMGVRPSSVVGITSIATLPTGLTLGPNIQIGSTSPYAKMIELANTVGVTDIWINGPVAGTNDCFYQMGAYAAANLNPNVMIHAEWGNEAWNFGFATFQFCCSSGSVLFNTQDYNNYIPGFVHLTGNYHKQFAAGMESAVPGSSARMIRTYGTFGGNATGNTGVICQQAIAQGFVIDEVCTAPYFDNGTSAQTILIPITDLMTTEQDLDLLELNIEYDGLTAQHTSQHLAALAANGFPNAKVWCYEGGPDSFSAYFSTTNYNVRNHHGIRNTRAYGIMLRYLQKLQDGGAEGINIFYLGASTTGSQVNHQNDQYLWSTYTAWNQQPGTGNPAIDTINNTNPNALDQIKSEIGGAINYWNTFVPGLAPPIVTSKRSIPGRNGQIKSTGYPRGLFRPVR